MFNDVLIDTLAAFPLMRLEFVIELQGDTELPEYTGSMLHGFFGYALKSVNERVFQACYMQQGAQQPRPYSVIPDLREKTHWQAGDLMRFEIKLFGEAHHISDATIAAVEAWQDKGLGENRTPYRLIAVNQIVAGKRTSSLGVNSLASQMDPAYFDPQWLTQCSLANVYFTTPMRLKHHGSVIQCLPNTDELVKQIMHRFKLLFSHWVADDVRVMQEIIAATPPPEQVSATQHYVDVRWDRFSKKMGKTIPLDGVKGHMQLAGPMQDVLPWLAVGEQLQIGGKTTFGYI